MKTLDGVSQLERESLAGKLFGEINAQTKHEAAAILRAYRNGANAPRIMELLREAKTKLGVQSCLSRSAKQVRLPGL